MVKREVDIPDWAQKDSWFEQVHGIGTFLQSKGFCTLKAGLSHLRGRAEREARALKNMGALMRTPREAVDCFLGGAASCWTMELSASSSKLLSSNTVVPKSEEFLRQVEGHLERIGLDVAACSETCFGLNLHGRLPGILHYSKSPGERGAPPLFDENEAQEYIARASLKKVSLFYFLGPSTATLRLTLLADKSRQFEVVMESDTVFIYRNDVCSASVEPEGTSIFIEVVFAACTRMSLKERGQEPFSVPTALGDFYSRRLYNIVECGVDSPSVEHDLLKLAFQAYAKRSNSPVGVVSTWSDLPTNTFFGGGVCPSEGTLLGGQDCITEIIAPPGRETGNQQKDPCTFGGKWDNAPYYDENWNANGEFKMYTKHMGVLNRGHDPQDDFDLRLFGISQMESVTADRRFRMLAESAWMCMRSAAVDDIHNMEVGFFAGISGDEQHYNLLGQVSKFSAWTNMSKAAIVSRLSVLWGSQGPAIAVDTDDSSSLAAVDASIRNLRQHVCSPFAVASGVNYYSNPSSLIMLCYAGHSSRSGRCRVFDSLCDGFVMGEAALSTLLGLFESEATEKTKIFPEGNPKALIIGEAMHNKGTDVTLKAPTASSLVELLEKSSKKEAGILFNIVDAVEVHSGGSRLQDVVELAVLASMTAVSGREAQPVPLRPAKSNFGNCGPASGLASVVRTCALIHKQLHGPIIHIHQFIGCAPSPEEQEPTKVGGRQQFLTEAVEALGAKQIIGVNNFGESGTNVSLIIEGGRKVGRSSISASKPIHWWPGGDPTEAQAPLRGYFVVGSWSNWEHADPMEIEAPGEYGYTVTLGENNYEDFQVWIDEDEDRILHPAATCNGKHSEVLGPDECVAKDLSWRIDGRAEKVRLVNEVQMKAFEEKTERTGAESSKEDQGLPEIADVDEEDEIRCIAVFRGSSLPSGHTDHKLESMPVVALSKEDAGRPGDKYRIRLQTRGIYKNLVWSKVTSTGPDVSIAGLRYVHKYHIIGDHNYWTFHEMQQAESEPGHFSTVVHVLKEHSNFQIYRDGDWEQGFYPKKVKGDANSEIRGPNGNGHGKNWQIKGRPGDLVRIQFQRRIVHDQEKRSISWQCVGHEEVDFEKLAQGHRYYLIGSMTGFEAAEEMKKDEETGNFSIEITVGNDGVEQFQILLNANFLAALHPQVNNATMSDEDHRFEGPDDAGSERYWAIGLDPRDAIGPGNHAIVHLDMDAGLPTRVWWEKYDSPDAHREYVAQGCWNTFERHCRLHGFRPYQSADRPAEMINPAPFMKDTVRKWYMPVSED